jgi:hypothetical protein
MAIELTEIFAAIGTEQFDAVVAFYTALFGRAPDERIRDVYVAFRLPGLHLGIFRPREATAADFRNRPDRCGGLSLVLQVPRLEPAMAELTRLGSPPAGPVVTASHGREVYVHDPDGNRLILVERTS